MKVQPLTNPIPAGVLALSLCFCPMESPADYVNTYTINGITWHLSADSVTGTYYSDSANWPENVSVVFTDVSNHMFDWGVIYYNMTLTGYGYASSGHGTDLVIPATIQWDSHGSDGVESGPLQFIASNAFYDKNLTSVKIPSSILSVEIPCFRNCSHLESIAVCLGTTHEISTPADASVCKSNYLTKDGVLYNADMTKLLKYPEGKTDRFFVVPETVTELAPYCFANTKLVAVQFQGDCPTVADTAFSGSHCVVYYPDGANGYDCKPLGGGAYAYPIPDNGVEIVDGVAWSYHVENGLAILSGCSLWEEIDGSSFESALPKNIYGHIDIPSQLGGYPIMVVRAIESCWNITSVTIPEGINTIEDGAFFRCGAMTDISIPSSVTNIGGGYAFRWCSSLAQFSVAEQNPAYRSIDGVLFSANGSTLVRCPDARTGDYVIPSGVATIAHSAFFSCGLSSLTIPETVTEIGYGAFHCCYDLESFSVSDGNRNYAAINGVLFSKDGTILITYPIGKEGNYDIPDGVETIAAYAFEDCWDLTSVTIPDSVTNMEEGVFCNCSSLTSITIPDSVVSSLGDEVFRNCYRLETVTIGANVTGISGHASFCGCSSLTSIAIPASVKEIGWSAFSGCLSLEQVELSDGIETIGGDAFSGCESLSRLIIPNSVTSIGDNAFDGCSSLERIYLPARFEGNLDDNWRLPNECAIVFTMTIETPTLPVATLGEAYSATLSVSGGMTPHQWSADGLPTGLSISQNGTISGTPTESGSFPVLVSVSDADGESVSASLLLYVRSGLETELEIVTDSLPDGEALQEYETTLSATGGAAPYTWSVPTPDAPAVGMSSSFAATGTAQEWRGDDNCWTLDLPFSFPFFGATYDSVKVNSNGTLSFGSGDFTRTRYEETDFLGTPMIAVLWNDLRTDGTGCDVFVSSTASSVTIRWKAEYYSYDDDPSFNASATLHADGRIVLAYGAGNANGGFVGFSAGNGATSFSVVEPNDGWGNAPDVSFSAASAGLPAGLSLSEGGVLSGTPTRPGSFSFSVSVASADGQVASKGFSLDVVSAPLAIVTDATLPIALTEESYWQALEATGGTEPYTWEIVDPDDWPAWLRADYIDYWDDWGYECPYLSSDWCPSEDDIGTHTFALRVTDAEGSNVVKTFTLEVQENPNHAPVIESWTPNEASVTIHVGETIVFSMEASDPDGDELSIGWQLEDENGNYLRQLFANELGNVTFNAEEEGLFQIWCWASDGFHNSSPAHSWQLSVVSADAPLVSTVFPHAVEGVYYETQLSATGGTAPYTWAMAGDSEDWIDAWLDEDGLFEWTSGDWESNRYHQFPVTVTDAEGRSSTQWISIYLESNPNERPVIDSITPEWGYNAGATTPIGKAIVFSVEAHDPEGEPLTFVWALDNEPLETTGPSWTWTPGRTDLGSHSLCFHCSDGERDSWWQWWYFDVVSTNVLRAVVDLPIATIGEPYSASFSVSGGTEPHVWGGPEYAMARETNSFAESGEAQDWAEDDEAWSVSLPFSFPFYGRTYDEVWVSDNGTICLDGSFSKWKFNEGEFKSHALIAPLWADLDGNRQTIYVESSVSGEVTIRWATHFWGTSSGAEVIAFAATLCADGAIRFTYDGFSCRGSVGLSAGDGVRFVMPEDLQNSSLGGGEDIVFRPATFAPGLVLSTNGTVSGTPTEAGTYHIPVTVVDDEGASWSGTTDFYVVGVDAAVTRSSPIPVPYSWLDSTAVRFVTGVSGDYETAATATAANGRPVWECYVADLDPEDENDDLVADIEMVDGRPVVTILKGEKASREYETQGAPAPGGPWGKPDDGSRFFRVKVSLP